MKFTPVQHSGSGLLSRGLCSSPILLILPTQDGPRRSAGTLMPRRAYLVFAIGIRARYGRFSKNRRPDFHLRCGDTAGRQFWNWSSQILILFWRLGVSAFERHQRGWRTGVCIYFAVHNSRTRENASVFSHNLGANAAPVEGLLGRIVHCTIPC